MFKINNVMDYKHNREIHFFFFFQYDSLEIMKVSRIANQPSLENPRTIDI